MNLSVKIDGVLQTQLKFDGENGGIWTNGTARKLEGEELARLRLQSPLFPELLFQDSFYHKEKLGIVTLDGKEVFQVRVTAPGGLQTDLFYDLNTGLKVRQSVDVAGENPPLWTYFEDYRTVQGILFPWKVTTATGDGAGYAFRTIRILVNQRLADAVFAL